MLLLVFFNFFISQSEGLFGVWPYLVLQRGIRDHGELLVLALRVCRQLDAIVFLEVILNNTP